MLSSTYRIKEGWGNDHDVDEQTWKNPHGYSGTLKKNEAVRKELNFLNQAPFLALCACFSLSEAVT